MAMEVEKRTSCLLALFLLSLFVQSAFAVSPAGNGDGYTITGRIKINGPLAMLWKNKKKACSKKCRTSICYMLFFVPNPGQEEEDLQLQLGLS